ncbi:MAG: 16S rRNA (adenine(1518)-N(6)/adenine(1519)-N(6))-dimethyltransferase RsmA [Methylococcales bacterium]
MSHTARKRFGQNFLHDYTIIYNILSSIAVQPDQHWLEIGPGLGALTEPLLKEHIRLDVVELDRDLVAFLKEKFKDSPNLQIHSGDALRFDFQSLVENNEKLRVIGNLPYNISTPLMFHLLENAAIFEDMHFMLQKEVVDRICAQPGSKKYGRLSVMMQYYLVPHQLPPVAVADLKQFNQVVTQAFSQRRKTLRNSLKKLISEQEMLDLGIQPTLRAENISLHEFANLSNLVTNRQE